VTVLRRADGRETTLHADRTTLGRAPGCDVVLDDPGVAPRHASILRTDRGWLLVDESGGLGVWVDDVSVANHFLREGETLRLGSTELHFSDRGATLLGTPRPPLRPALELEGLRSAPAGARPSSTPTAPGTRAPSSTPTLEGRAEPPPPEAPVVSGRTIPAPIAAPPPYAGAPIEDEVPRATRSIYEPPAPISDADDRPFVRGDAPRRAQSVYSLGDDGPRASLDPVVDVYTLGRPGAGGSSQSVYSLGTAPTHTPARGQSPSIYSLGEAETILPPGAGHELPPPPPPPPAISSSPAPRSSGASVYSMGAPDRGPAGTPASGRSVYSIGADARREPERRPGESWSWVQPEPDRGRRRASSLPRPGRGLMMFGLALVVLGLVLAGIAFALGLSVADLQRALTAR
jgi:predicted component of type VI protein secretion system